MGNATWKRKLLHEMKVYYVNVLYLFFFFGMFNMYRRLVLAEHQIDYLNYGISLIEALVLAKVIMIGDALHLAFGLEDRPLIISTLYKTLVFSLWVALFKAGEHVVRSLLDGNDLDGSIRLLLDKSEYEVMAGSLVTLLAFIPYFAMRELGRVLGEHALSKLFFREREAVTLVISTKKSEDERSEPVPGPGA